jgi:cytidylate kinase
LIVAVDGPAGSGKSTVARSLAARHGFRYLDTGAMYRALAWLALERGTDLEDGPALAELGRANPVDLDPAGKVIIAATDATQAIRLPEVDRVVSGVARHLEVRALMRRWQRELAAQGDCVIEGRDIGRVVVPNAEIKVYLVADERVRVARRAGERPGHNSRELASDLHRRDESDAAQMEPAPDAIEIDTTNLSVDEVVVKIEELMTEKGATEREYLYGYSPRHLKIGQATIGNTTRLLGRLRSYGLENVPMEGGMVLAANHFSFIDPPAFGAACPRRVYFLAKTEVAYAPVLKQVLRYFGTVPVRRGESDREAVRRMREIARAGEMLGIFIEGTRQRTGVPGPAMPGAAMVALQENVPVLPAAIRGSEHWRIWNLHRLTIAWGEPMIFDGLPANSKGYREATTEIAREIRRLWEWLGEVEAQGRPSGLTVPGR